MACVNNARDGRQKRSITWQNQVLIMNTVTEGSYFLPRIPGSVLRPLLVSWGLVVFLAPCTYSYRSFSIGHCHLIPRTLLGIWIWETLSPHTQQYLKGTAGEIFIKWIRKKKDQHAEVETEGRQSTAVLPASHPHFQTVFPTHLLLILATLTSLGLLWTSDRPVAEPSTGQNTTLTKSRHPCLQRHLKSQSHQASSIRPCFRQRGHAVCYLRLMYKFNFGLNCLMSQQELELIIN